MTIGPLRSDQPSFQQANIVEVDDKLKRNSETEIDVRKKIASMADEVRINSDRFDFRGLNEKDITDDNSIYNPRDFPRKNVTQPDPEIDSETGSGNTGLKLDKIRQRIEDSYYEQSFVKEKIAEKLVDILSKTNNDSEQKS